MKVKVKAVFFDDNGLHKPGEVVEVSTFDSATMELVQEDPKPAPEKKEPAKKTTTKTKKG